VKNKGDVYFKCAKRCTTYPINFSFFFGGRDKDNTTGSDILEVVLHNTTSSKLDEQVGIPNLPAIYIWTSGKKTDTYARHICICIHI
jgi:hypothetical protein